MRNVATQTAKFLRKFLLAYLDRMDRIGLGESNRMTDHTRMNTFRLHRIPTHPCSNYVHKLQLHYDSPSRS